ncbi:GNAT family N-acetyltransferase [Mesorhizobium microcysteis]|uniref:GNAT family N-acetyltransferase n=1 Tax=Neoaquamicrobium microcysteis TaxID=2682781 RepID=A0A5D4H5G6_9HYPH|nr:GNAT family N-acetyltransferase [Mesorhizobium microcysteis]TYR34675.1 GNAT family N-acetyltransferase [Mesorhizobium microcysteis]
MRPLQASDHDAWRRLWTDYLTFYETTVPETVYLTTWQRLFSEGDFEPRGLLALINGRPVGLVHYLFHRSCWSIEGNCYLQDLYTAPEARGMGAGEALIEAVRKAAAERGVTNVYWMTHETNATARRLYDRVARKTGFIEYDLL